MKSKLMGRIFPLLILIIGTASGCPFNLADVRYSPVEMQVSAKSERAFTLTRDVEISRLPCGYSRTLRNATRWDLIGELPKGEIYRSKDQNLTLECSNVYEAYLVVAEDSLVGFYLPVEKGFVSISDPIRLPLIK